MKLNNGIILLLISIFYLFIFFDSISGDAAIYFTFAQHFFEVPFSFGQGEVQYGATGPLYVVWLAIHEFTFGNQWFWVAKISNWIIIVYGFLLLHKSTDSHPFPWTIVLGAISTGIWLTGLELYETALAFFISSLVLTKLAKDKYTAVTVLAGLLPLVRPELIIASTLIQLYCFWMQRTKKNVFMAFLSYLPLLLYVLYMYDHTGTIVPTSVEGRAITALEVGSNYIDRVIVTLRSLLRPSGLLYLFAVGCTLLWAKKVKHTPFMWLSIVVTLSYGALYLISPPGQYINRYLLVTLPFLLLYLNELLNLRFEKLNPATSKLIFSLGFLYLIGVNFISPKLTRYDESYDTILLKDLSEAIEQSNISQGKMLIYEIQSQYYLENDAVSGDGIVGGEIFPFLKGEISLDQWLIDNDIDYLVTMNGFAYRKSLQSTELFDLYLHDLNKEVGSSFELNVLSLEKVITNPIFADSSLHKIESRNDILYRVYNEENPNWEGHPPLWNSVYRIKKGDK